MRTIAVAGNIGVGKSTFMQGFEHADSTTVIRESSGVITLAANHFNTSLGNVYGDDRFSVSCDTALAHWLSAELGASLRAATPLPIDTHKLRITVDDMRSDTAHFEKLHTYLDAVEAEPDMLYNSITSASKEQYRPLLQWLGGIATHRLGYSLWFRELMRQAVIAADEGCQTYVIATAKYPEDEVEIRKDSMAVIIELENPAVAARDEQDPTERSRSLVRKDTVVINNGTIDQIQRVPGHVLADMDAGNLQPRYQAADY